MSLGMKPLVGPGGDQQEAQGIVGDRRSTRRESSYLSFFALHESNAVSCRPLGSCKRDDREEFHVRGERNTF